MNNAKYLMEIIHGFSGSYYLYSICELGLLDKMWGKKVTLTKMANYISSDEEITYRLIRPLISLGIIEEENKTYILTNIGETLCELSPDSIKSIILMCGREGMKCWQVFYEALIQHKKPFEILDGKNPFLVQNENSEKFNTFNNSMKKSSEKLNLEFYFKESNLYGNFKIVDIGGGSGTIIIKFLNYYRDASGIIIDLEFVKEAAEININNNSLNHRCKFYTMDFFNPIYENADVFILSRILHDWSDNDAKKILTNIKNSMKKGNKLLIIEKILPASIKDGNMKLYIEDLNVWAMCGGKERTLAEFTELFDEVGLKRTKIYNCKNSKFVLEVELM